MGTPSPPPNEDVEKIQTVEVKKRDNADPDLSTTHPNSQVRFRKTFVKFVILNTRNYKLILSLFSSYVKSFLMSNDFHMQSLEYRCFLVVAISDGSQIFLT